MYEQSPPHAKLPSFPRLTEYNNSVIKQEEMKPSELKAARLKKGWVQVQVAEYLGVTQAYVNMLENGKRQLTPALRRRVTALYGLSPETLPLSEEFVPANICT
jgi:DNA-binding transcriptional regulator YiaG